MKYFISIIFLLCFTVNLYADINLVEKKEAQDFIDTLVTEHNFSKDELIKIFTKAQFQKKIIELMERPYEARPWDTYKQIFLTADRIEKGLQFWQKHQESLSKAQDKYKVPAHIIVAILGVETYYGEHQGKYKVLDALTTLAFNYPARAKFFKKELKEFLLLSREQNKDPFEYYGSYAGAIGSAQFMPSSYRYYADTLEGKGKSDLINNPDDAIASVANYFKKHGWKINEDVAIPVEIKGESYKDIKTNNRKAAYQISDLLNKGIKPVYTINNQQNLAGLIELKNNLTLDNKEFWLTYPNFYVITRYNSSTQYALVVHLLAQQLKTSLLSKEESNTKAKAYT